MTTAEDKGARTRWSAEVPCPACESTTSCTCDPAVIEARAEVEAMRADKGAPRGGHLCSNLDGKPETVRPLDPRTVLAVAATALEAAGCRGVAADVRAIESALSAERERVRVAVEALEKIATWRESRPTEDDNYVVCMWCGCSPGGHHFDCPTGEAVRALASLKGES